MKTAIVLGGAACLQEDLASLPIRFDGVVACNDAGAYWPGELDAWVTLHPLKMNVWRQKRRQNGHPEPNRFYAHNDNGQKYIRTTPYKFPGLSTSGSSGMFAAKVALIDLKYDRVVLCGCPMMRTPHFFDRVNWRSATHFRHAWESAPKPYLERMRSMSGWTFCLLGSPKDWVNAGEEPDKRDYSAAFPTQTATRR